LPLTHSLTHSLTLSLTHTHTHTHNLTHSLTHTHTHTHTQSHTQNRASLQLLSDKYRFIILFNISDGSESVLCLTCLMDHQEYVSDHEWRCNSFIFNDY